MIDETLSLAIPCRADEPDLGSTLESLFAASLSPQLPSGCVRELLICINGVGPDQPCPEPSRRACPPLLAVRDFCARHAITIQEIALSSAEQAQEYARQQPRPSSGAEGQGAWTCRVLLADWRGKPRAMNTLWQWACGDLLLFCDADVRLDPQAIAHPYTPRCGRNRSSGWLPRVKSRCWRPRRVSGVGWAPCRIDSTSAMPAGASS